MANKKNKINQNYTSNFDKLDTLREDGISINIKERKIIFWFKKNWKYIIGLIVSISLLVYLFMKSQPSVIFHALKKTNYLLVLASFGLTLILFLVKAIRWSIILLKQKCKLPFLETMKLVLIGTFGSSVTPGKMGDILRAYYLTKNHPETKIGTSVFSVVFDRILDLGSILLIGLITCPLIFIEFQNPSKDILFCLSLSLIVITIIIFLVYNKKVAKTIMTFILKLTTKIFRKKETSEKINISMCEIIDDFYSSQNKYLKRDYLFLGILSILFWFIIGVQGYLLLLACNTPNINLIVVISILCIAAIIAFAVPLSISGIGVRDSVIVLLLGLILGVTADKSLILSILQTFLNVLIPAFIGAILMLFNRKGKKNIGQISVS